MRIFVAALIICVVPLNANIALVALFAIIRGLPMTAFLMTLGSDAAPRRLRQRH
jgi:hypothetical protein